MVDDYHYGTVYIGVVGPETDYAVCRDSIQNLERRQGDVPPRFVRATKGYEARENHIQYFLKETDSAFILLLDHDMIFEADTLERLRRHGRPFVTGLYMRRRYQPILPVWYHPFDGQWPMKPFTEPPERGRLHRLGASGWGCILIHRDVLVAMRPILKGEDYVIEDDMDVWPYDLKKVLAGEEKIRVLRGLHDVVGSDLRFPFYAKVAGYQLWGDPDVRPTHMLNYPLSPDDFEGLPSDLVSPVAARVDSDFQEARAQWQTAVANLELLPQIISKREGELMPTFEGGGE